MNLRIGRSLAVFLLSLAGAAYAADGPYDLVFRNARVVDGTRSPWYRADVAVRGDTIVRIAPSITEPAERVIDVGGNVVSPGFIDVHTHAGREIFTVPTADNYIRQGVTSIHAALLPKWALEGGLKETIARIKDPAQRAKMKTEVAQIIHTERGGGDPRNVAISLCPWDASLAGKNLADIAQQRGLAPTVENAADVTLWLVENGSCGGIFHAIGEEDVVRVMAHPATMIASDGGVVQFGVGAPHPRSYGTFARVLGVYVREKGVITLEDAVRKMTSYPASRLALQDRGVLKVGMKADIAVFDPARVKDMATFEKPHQYAVGFEYVVVNGQVVYEGGKMTEARSGRVVYGVGRSSMPMSRY